MIGNPFANSDTYCSNFFYFIIIFMPYTDIIFIWALLQPVSPSHRCLGVKCPFAGKEKERKNPQGISRLTTSGEFSGSCNVCSRADLAVTEALTSSNYPTRFMHLYEYRSSRAGSFLLLIPITMFLTASHATEDVFFVKYAFCQHDPKNIPALVPGRAYM